MASASALESEGGKRRQRLILTRTNILDSDKMRGTADTAAKATTEQQQE